MSETITTAEPFIVTREFLDDLEANPDKVDTLTPDIYEAAKPYILREADWPEAVAAQETDAEREAREANEAAAASPEAERPGTRVEPEDDSATRVTSLTTAKAARDAAVKAADAILDEADIDYNEDEDAYRAQQARKAVARRERDKASDAYQDILHNETVTPLGRRVAEGVEAKFYREADGLAQHFPVLKTSKGLRAAEKEAIPYIETIYKTFNGGTMDGLTDEIRDQAWSKYLQDEAFRKTLPAAPADFDNVSVMLEAKEMVRRSGGTLRGAVAEIMIERGSFGKMIENIRQDGARAAGVKVQEALHRRNEEVVPAPVGGGGSGQPKPMVVPFDKATAEIYVNNFLDKTEKNPPVPLTDFEKIHLTTAQKLLGLDPISI